ncbi:MAG TPA: outer membrane protein assembly factor BamE [Patescibacteria group bacterium]|nr:outer membrane protein assembly factor BamE [Patescibacteria group bacterium]
MNAKGLLVSAAVAVLLTAGCSPTLAVRGNILQDYQVADVKVGQDTQSDILRKLGSPTTKAPFDDNTWYYMGQKTEKHGILDAKIDQEKVYQVTFDQQGIVTGIQDVTHKRADIPYSRDSTPTTGNELTVTQQLLGNLGRFNKSDADKKKKVGDDSGGAPGR